MKQYDTGDLRNLAVVGHGAAGKTTLVEAMLALVKEINRMGTIETGTTVSDYHPGEKERQISIHSTERLFQTIILVKKKDKYLFTQHPFMWNGIKRSLILLTRLVIQIL